MAHSTDCCCCRICLLMIHIDFSLRAFDHTSFEKKKRKTYRFCTTVKVIFFEFISKVKFDLKQRKTKQRKFFSFYSNKNNSRKTKSIFHKQHRFSVDSVLKVDAPDYSVSKDRDSIENRNPLGNAIAIRFVEVRPSPKRTKSKRNENFLSFYFVWR